MCGIVGIIKRNNAQIEKSQLKFMTDEMSHRGPDAEGIWIADDGSVGLGHRRLSIIDLSADGIQPMVSRNGRYVISFNGEVYNYIELRKMLETKGVQFKTDTDTEVILECFSEYGTDCINMFNGMWAFAIYDTQKQEMIISRDRFGVKPLYYVDRNDCFVFASEIKAILKVFPEEKQPDYEMIGRFFTDIPEDIDEKTFYSNIKIFPKSSVWIINSAGEILDNRTYWKITPDVVTRKIKNPVREFRELFEDAVKIRLRSDVPVGSCLSGGLDSSAIVAVATKKYGAKMDTFSSVFSDKSCDESDFIECVVEDTGAISHYAYPEKKENFIENLKQMIYFHDNPPMYASPYSGFCVYKIAKGNVKVLLDGQGADELFGGYFDVAFSGRIQDLLNSGGIINWWKALRLAGGIRASHPDIANRVPEKALVQMLGVRGYKKYINERTENQRENNVDKDIFTDEFSQYVKPGPCLPSPSIVSGEFEKELYKELNCSTLPRILHDVDRNSMSQSLEVRLPFLDYRIVEFAWALSADFKVRNSWSKYVVRMAMKKYLPKKIWSRRNKFGLPIPFAAWMREESFRNEVWPYIEKFKERGILRPDSIDEYMNEVISGKRIDNFFFRIIALELWMEEMSF